MVKIEVRTDAQMRKLGSRLGSVALIGGTVFYLIGELGAGKTTLVRGLIQGTGYQGAVKSPSYTLMELYPLQSIGICHLDLYRFKDPLEWEYLGANEYFSEDYCCLVEWPEHGDGILKLPDVVIRIDVETRGKRRVVIEGETPLGRELVRPL